MVSVVSGLVLILFSVRNVRWVHRRFSDVPRRVSLLSCGDVFVVHVFFFFNCYLAAPRPTLGHYRGDSLTHPMLITAFYIFDPRVTGSLVTRLGP